MKITNKYLTKMFKTSPGNFTKRETALIRYFLKRKENIADSPGLIKFRKALNNSDNNVKWILKTFLMANIERGKKKSLRQVITTIKGKFYENEKIVLKVEKGKAILEPKYSKHRYPMFADRSGMGANLVYKVEILKGRKIQAIKKPGIKKAITGIKKVTTGSKPYQKSIKKAKNEMYSIQMECDAILATLDKYAAPVESMEDLADIIADYIKLLHPNKGSLDFVSSGIWHSRLTTTAKAQNDKLIIDFINIDRKTKQKNVSHYEFYGVSEGTVKHDVYFQYGKEYKLVGTYNNSGIILKGGTKNLAWVFKAYKPTLNVINDGLTRLIASKAEKTSMKGLVVKAKRLQAHLNSFWNKTFRSKNDGTHGGQVQIEGCKDLIKELRKLSDALKIIAGKKNKKSPPTKKDLFPSYIEDSETTALDLNEYNELAKKLLRKSKKNG